MRLLYRLWIVVALCFVAVALPAMPAQAQSTYILLSPDEGVPGTEVTVHGYNFTHDTWVDIYYDGVLVDLYVNGIYSDGVKSDEDGDFRADFIVPESCTGHYEVLAKDEENVKDYADFTVEPGLTLSTEVGPVNTSVTVEGRGFAEDEEDIELLYYFDGAAQVVAEDIEASEYGYWQTSFQVPSSARGDHDIDARGADTKLKDVEDVRFEVTPEINLAASSGTVGESIPITGTGFESEDSYIKVLFAGDEVETEPEIIRADENGEWDGEVSFKVPDRPAGEYIVTAEGQSTRKEDVDERTFTIESGLMLSAYQGHVGMNLTVTGGGFPLDEVVVIKYGGGEVATTKTDEEGIFQISFLVPESKYGVNNITGEVGGETEASATFIMEQEAPDTPELVSPPDGDRTGFIGSVKLTFEWSEVEDLSGVYYSLKIWTVDNVTKVSKVGLVGTNYTLNDIEALPQGTYYWSVQAVDGAENESGWTEPRSFQIGVMPLWAFIVIVVVAAGGIGALVYFRVIRQRIYYY